MSLPSLTGLGLVWKMKGLVQWAWTERRNMRLWIGEFRLSSIFIWAAHSLGINTGRRHCWQTTCGGHLHPSSTV